MVQSWSPSLPKSWSQSLPKSWPKSWIIACDPCVTFRFQTEYPEARSIVFPFESLVYRFISQPVPQFLTPYDQRLYLRKLGKTLFPNWHMPFEFEDVTRELFSSLKDKKISAPAFTKATHALSHRFSILAKLYEAYGQKKGMWDGQDILELAIQNLKQACFKTKFPSKILILAYQLSDLQKTFLEVLSKKVEVEQLLISEPEKSPPHIPSVFETQTSEQEVELIGIHLEKEIREGTSPSSLFVFCIRLKEYKRELESVLGRAQIPFSFWNSSLNSSGDTHERVSLLEWHPNTMVFPTMKKIFLCGASFLSLPPSFLRDEEKVYFNHVFQTSVFKTQSDHQEEAKRFLHVLRGRCQKLTMTYRSRPAAALEDFLKEFQKISVAKFHSKKSAGLESSKKERARTLLFSSQNKLGSNINQKTDFLPQTYSIRSLTQYQKCPYGFLLKECLNLHPTKEEGLGLTLQEEGEWMHDILWRTFSKSLSLEEAMDESVSHLTPRFQKELLESDQKRMTKILRAFLEEEKGWRAKSRFIPRYFELSFGTKAQKPLELTWKGKSLFLRGKVDRIDVDEEAREFVVIDYKTGATVPSTREVMEGKSFQLTLYAIALEQLFLPGYIPSRGFFYRIKERDIKKGFLCETQEEWKILKEKALSEIFSLVGKMKTLSFPATPKHCYATCELKNMCEHV